MAERGGAASPDTLRPDLVLDDAELQEAVQQDQSAVFLLQFLTRAEAALSVSTKDSDAFVAQALRLCGACCGDKRPPLEVEAPARRGVLDAVGALHASLHEPVCHDTLARHVSALFVISELLRAFPDETALAHDELLPLCVRLAKASASPVLARYYALLLLERVLLQSMRELGKKELHKVLKHALGEQAGPVVRGAARCLAALAQTSASFAARSDVEAMLAQCARLCNDADVCTRRALAHLGAALLAQTQRGGAQATRSDELGVKASTAASLFTTAEMLSMLQALFSRVSHARARNGVLQIYAALFARQGVAWLETHYDEVLHHLVYDLGARVAAALPSFEAACMRGGVRMLLQAYLCNSLSEPAKERAAAALHRVVFSLWPPPTPSVAPPSDAALCLALELCAALVAELGGLARALQEILYEPIVRLLAHPQRAVQVRAAWWLRLVCSVEPSLLAPCYTQLLHFVRRDVAALSTPQHDRGVSLRARLAGHSVALGALVPVAASHPLYALNEDAEDVFALATDLLHHVAHHGLSEAAAATHAAWTLIGSLFALGPLFARPHIPRLLTLWRNALTLPTLPTAANFSDAAWVFLFQVRHGALAALLSFLMHGGTALLTNETSRRVAAMLSNVLAFLDGFAAHLRASRATLVPGADDGAGHLLCEREPLLRAYTLRCFTQLADHPALHVLQRNLVSLALQTFCKPDRLCGSAAQAAISARSGAFRHLWDVQDQYAFGVTSLLSLSATHLDAWSATFVSAAFRCAPAPPLDTQEAVGEALDALAHTPVLGALENEPSAVYLVPPFPAPDAYTVLSPYAPAPPPARTAQVDAAIELFAAIFAFQERDTQVAAVEYMHAACTSSRADRDAGRTMALYANATVALLGALRTASAAPLSRARRPAGLNNDRVNSAIRLVAQTSLLEGDLVLRDAAAELYGRLAALVGSQGVAAQVQFLVEQILDNRHADARASCALAAGQLYCLVGGLHASPLTQTMSSLLLSLSADPHPAVHHAALHALFCVVDAASLGYQPYVNSTLGLMAQLYAAATHEPEGGSAGSSNLRVRYPAYAPLASVVSAVVGVLGSDLLESPSKRSLLYALLFQLARDAGAGSCAQTEALQGVQRLGLIVPHMLETRAWAQLLFHHVEHGDLALQRAAATGYYQMAQRGTRWLVEYGGSVLLQTLLVQLDRQPSLAPIRQLMLVWLQQSAPTRACAWIDLCAAVVLTPELFGAASSTVAAAATGHAEDEEAASLQRESGAAPVRAITGWRTQLFVLQCVHHVFRAVRADAAAAAEHLGAHTCANDARVMSSRVPELIKVAFNASTAAHRAVRLQGLAVLRDVMESFAATRDPHFPDAQLLVQYQAPLAAALTPAFGADSSPEVLAAALAVCAAYLISGVSQKDLATNRIAKLLLAARRALDDPAMASLGEMQSLSPNAVAYVKIAVLHAWARLALAQAQVPLLGEVLGPNMEQLAAAWATALTEYAVLRETEHGAVLGASAMLPRMRANSLMTELVQKQMLSYFAGAWPTMLQALTTVLASDEGVRGALQKSTPFFAMYGLALEMLCAALECPSTDRSVVRIVLASLNVLAQCADEVLLDPRLFAELLQLAVRAFLVADMPIQLGMLTIVRTLSLTLRERLLEDEDGMVHDAHFTRSKLGLLLHAVYAFLQRIPALPRESSEKSSLLSAAWHTFADMLSVCTRAVQHDVLALAFHTSAEQIRREDDTAAALGPSLFVLGALARAACHVADTAMQRTLQGYLTAMLDVSDAMRSRSGEIAACKSRNTLVSVSLVLAALDARLAVSSEVVEQFAFLLTKQLDMGREASMVGLQCMRIMMQAASSPEAMQSSMLCVGHCTAPLIAFLAKESAGEAHAAGIDTLLLLVDVLADDRAAAFCIVLPVLVAFLAHAPHHGPSAAQRALVSARVVDMAREHASEFKHATAALDEPARNTLHDALRCAMRIPSAPAAAQKATARISLKTFGA
ncbi:hypothetical protein MVES_001403 [Malassezia vespertilionis]|uniref:LAA1-like C-terminal TPR repeats domain-containing protein n=1 Tax=Malassezia vespertilionis TaxID=2020962 RepID=A0A2N1JCF6_9BASI|nr:hypothetical protein MVES_001403 [Malassezia vespertilionis]